MQARLFAALIVSAGTAMPAAAQSINAYPPSWFVYAVTPFCQLWQNGVQACFPVALVGPAPTALPAGLQPLMPPPVAALPANPQPVPGVAWPGAMPPYPVAPMALAPMSPAPAPVPTPAASRPGAGGEQPASAPAAARQPPASPAPAQAPAMTADTPPPARPDQVTVLFAFDSADLTADGQDQLDAWLAGAPGDAPIRVTGHADRLGPASYNQALSLRRARSVLHYLTGKGARPNDIRVAAKGEYAPVVQCRGGPTPETKDCLAPNRRVEISLR